MLASEASGHYGRKSSTLFFGTNAGVVELGDTLASRASVVRYASSNLAFGTRTIWISAPPYTARIEVQNDVVVNAAPIFRWTVGKKFAEVERYFRGRFKESLRIEDITT